MRSRSWLARRVVLLGLGAVVELVVKRVANSGSPEVLRAVF